MSLEISLKFLFLNLKKKLTIKHTISRTKIFFPANSGLRIVHVNFLKISYWVLLNFTIIILFTIIFIHLSSYILLLKLENFSWTITNSGTKILFLKLLKLQIWFIPNLHVTMSWEFSLSLQCTQEVDFQGYFAPRAKRATTVIMAVF